MNLIRLLLGICMYSGLYNAILRRIAADRFDRCFSEVLVTQFPSQYSRDTASRAIQYYIVHHVRKAFDTYIFKHLDPVG